MDDQPILVEMERQATGGALLKVSGSLDAFTKDRLREKFNLLLQEGHPAIALDLSKVHYLDSTGVAGLLRAKAMAQDRGRHLEIVNPSSQVERILTLLGMRIG